ncbi:MAG: TonB-dependent receptor domain-containing protein [Kiritimatiellia bacterium]
MVVFSGVAASGNEPLERETLIVEASPLEGIAQASGAGSVADVLLQVPEVDLQLQGVAGGQSDISIRGSSFSGAGIALNGLGLPNAQTEHFHAELPFAVEWFGVPRVRTGFNQASASSGFLVGTLDFGILPVATRRVVSGGISEYDSFWGQVLVQQQVKVGDHAVGVGGFGGAVDLNRVDLPDNDVRIRRAGAQLQVRNSQGDQTDVLFGRQEKTFGVRGYYGVNPSWAGEEELGDTMFYAGTSRRRPGGDVRASVYYREFTDDYRLFWSLPGMFENNHRTHVAGGMIDGRWYGSNAYWLDWRVTASEDRIRSSALGLFNRQQMSLGGIPGVRLGAWQYQAGVRFEVFEDEDHAFLPQAAVTYHTPSGVAIQASYSESVRQPSYTELNYASPASLGNAGLENQKAATSELQVCGAVPVGIEWKAGIFYRTSLETVDWIRREAASVRWEADNIGTVKAAGVEARARWVHTSGSSVGAYYLGMDQSDDSHVYASRYARDYSEHLVRVSARAALGSRVTLGYNQTLRQQASNPLREGGRKQYEGSVRAAWMLRKYPEILLLASVDNVWDDDYQVFPGQDTAAGRRFSTGMRVEW